jgi:tetratricopeptide (TPR) repeat protein
MSDRLDTLQKFLQDDPLDPFNRYALALEYANRKEYSRSAALFAEVIERHPDYIPAYQQLAALLTETGKAHDARTMLEEGIRRATNAGDAHAAAEMRDALDELGA